MRQTRLTWQIISAILGLLFVIWGSITHLYVLLPGDVWLVVPGSLMLAIGIFGIIDDVIQEKTESSSTDDVVGSEDSPK